MSLATESRLIDALAPLVKELRASTALRTPESEGDLQDLLYDRFHGRQDTLRPGAPTADSDELTDREFVERLSNANSGIGPKHDEWTVCAIEHEGRYAVELDGLTLWIDEPAPVAVGERVPVRMPKEYRNLYPGHYVLIGDADDGSLTDSVRLYWNVNPEGAEALVRYASALFNRAQIPFRLKVLSSPAACTRADSGILYLPLSHRAEGALVVHELYREVKALMREPVSRFVLPLAHGLGIAEDTVDGSSFGLHRSQLLASVLCNALTEAGSLSAITTALETHGYPPRWFYRNPGSTETYPDFRIDVD